MNNNLEHFGVMLDCSRNAVKTVDTVKDLISTYSDMGYNTFMLYTEDTYEIPEEPFFGYMRGRYTKEEIKEIDSYAKEKGVELIPCIETLSHLNQMVRWPVFEPFVDRDDILLIDDDRTYKLIDEMFSSIESMFSSRIVNVGMDEALTMGLGKYLEKHGYTDRHELFLKHLSKVHDIAKKHGFEMIMWSDMLFRFQNKGSYQCDDPYVSEESLKIVPDDIRLCYWDYYDWGDEHNDKHYDNMFRIHRKFSNELWFAAGAWTWAGFTPRNNYSDKVNAIAAKYTEK